MAFRALDLFRVVLLDRQHFAKFLMALTTDVFVKRHGKDRLDLLHHLHVTRPSFPKVARSSPFLAETRLEPAAPCVDGNSRKHQQIFSFTVDATHEKVNVQGKLYITATKTGESVPWLWRIEVDSSSPNANRVSTPAGFPVRGAKNLMEYQLNGGNRLYFSCDGAGTEFVTEDADDKRFRPCRRELWVTAE